MKIPFSRQWLACIFTAVSLAVPSIASATNGYFLIGFGAKSRGMGGVGVAYGQDGLAAAFNPAAMIQVKKTRVDIGMDLFVPKRSALHVSDTLPTDQESGQNLFPIPNMGGIYKFNRNLRMGFAFVGAGLGTRYSQKVVPGSGDSAFFNFNGEAGRDELGVFLVQAQMLPSIAYQFLKSKKYGRHTVGATLVFAIQTFRARGLAAFRDGALGYASGSTKLSDNGFDWSFGGGVRIGWLGQFMKKQRLTVGFNYSSRVYMTKFEDYSELFAEQGSFDIPENFALGASFKVTDKITIVGEVQQMLYSDVKSIANPGPNANDATDIFELCPLSGSKPQSECKTGEDDGLGFGWKDQTVWKLGADYKHNKKWTFRGGINYGKSPIPGDQVLFNLLAPATVEWHATGGFSYRPSKGQEWTVSYVHAFENTITGPTSFPPVGASPGDVDNGAISMYQDSLGISWGVEI